MINYESLVDALVDLRDRGYEADFATETDCLYCGDLDIRLDPEDFHVDEVHHFESSSSGVQENATLFAITSVSGVKGTLVDNYNFQINNFVMTQINKPAKAENDPRIFKEVRDFLKILNSGSGKPIEQLSPVDARKVLSDAQNAVSFDYSGIEESEMSVSHDGEKVRIHIVKPAGIRNDAPVFIYIHGGGWVLGDYPTHRRLVRDLVLASGAVAVFPDYTPSPEGHYPAAINQIYAVTRWVSEHGTEIGVNGKNLAVVGNSVGGNMTAAVVLMAKVKNGPAIKLQVMLWPVTDANFETDSYKDLGEGRFLSRNMMIWFWDNYLPDKNLRKEIYASPLQAGPEQLQGLPPALIQTAENDVLRDEGEAYARKLNEAGVPVTLTRYGGLIHDYGLLNALAEVPAVKTAILQAAAAIKSSLAE